MRPASRPCWINPSEAPLIEAPFIRPSCKFNMGNVGLAFVAGVLSTLSPCVLPLLPIVLATAASEHRAGPAALAAGLAFSFVVVGLFVALIGFSIGLDTDVFRGVAAALLLSVGLVLIVPQLQTRFALAAAPVSGWIEQRSAGFSMSGA